MSTAAPVRFLSEEYLAELEKLASAGQPVIPHANVRLQFRVLDAPQGTVDYHLVIEKGLFVRAARGRMEDADLEITVSYSDLVDFQAGELHAATAFVTGQFRVSGAKAKILELMLTLQTGHYQRFSAELWARTTW